MRKNYFLTLFLAAIFGLYACNDTAIDEIDQHVTTMQDMQNDMMDDTPDASMDNQWEAVQQLERINARFQNVPLGPGNANLPYPGYYGGAYINDDGKLVVYIKGNSDKLKQKVYDMVGSNDVIIRRANHSYGDLNRIMNGLNSFKLNPANAAASANWNAYALMDADNEVVVELDEFNDGKIKEFKKTVMNHPAIRFVQSTGPVQTEVQLEPGCKVAPNADMTGYSSFAFRARRNSDGAVGMVSAGHGFDVNDPIYYNGDYVGYCTFSQESGSVDISFHYIFYPDTYIPSNLLCTSSTYLSTATSQPGVGTVVNKRGASTGLTTGKITSTNKTITTDRGATLTNITQADYASDPGDSGGIVYTYISSTNTRYTVGAHLGAGGSYTYFTKADEALRAIGATRY